MSAAPTTDRRRYVLFDSYVLEQRRLPGSRTLDKLECSGRSSSVVEQGTHKLWIYPLWSPAWQLSTKPLTYVLYRQDSEEHITPIEHIPSPAESGA